ncbi:MAG TPA: hypothetical protein VE196_13615, partial [Pseudonocardiaceae bacterium]|nr:hypothetical protein [Pseudonocardiaceae bacterium]
MSIGLSITGVYTRRHDSTEAGAPARRKRGSIRRIGASLQVRVSAGDDPSTGDRIVLVEVVPIEK